MLRPEEGPRSRSMFPSDGIQASSLSFAFRGYGPQRSDGDREALGTRWYGDQWSHARGG